MTSVCNSTRGNPDEVNLVVSDELHEGCFDCVLHLFSQYDCDILDILLVTIDSIAYNGLSVEIS